MSDEQKSASAITLTGSNSQTTEQLKKQLEIPEQPKLDELPGLKARADALGISYSNNIGADTLREKIREFQAEQEAKTQEPVKNDQSAGTNGPDQNTIPLSEVTDEAVLRRRMYEDNMFLVRVRVTNLNPLKKNIPGEWFTVNNRYLGTVRKYVPFGEATDDGYHIPKIILDMMKERQFLSVKTKKSQNGTMVPSTQWVREFAIEELPYLTKEELDKLARQQAAAKGIE